MSPAEQVDFASMMEPVAARLLGEPNRHLSKPPKDIRYGTRGSLAIDLSAGCFFDHENGCGGGVIDLVASQLGCDRETAIGWLRREGFMPEPQQAAASSIVATYDYRDQNMVLLFQVCRFEPKDFRPRRPDGKFTLEGVRRILYRLPDVLKAIAEGSTIHLVEGEKDADNLHKLGVTATTNAGGANKWRSEYSETLRGADVVLVPDNDDPGRKHVEQIAVALTGVAKRVRVLDIAQHWSECPTKGDISDWIKAGGTADRLAEIVEALPDWTTSSPNSQFAASPWPTMEPEAFYGLAGKWWKSSLLTPRLIRTASCCNFSSPSGMPSGLTRIFWS